MEHFQSILLTRNEFKLRYLIFLKQFHTQRASKLIIIFISFSYMTLKMAERETFHYLFLYFYSIARRKKAHKTKKKNFRKTIKSNIIYDQKKIAVNKLFDFQKKYIILEGTNISLLIYLKSTVQPSHHSENLKTLCFVIWQNVIHI